MKYGSVCSGIEAASCAWHPLGWRAEWLAEIEPFPAAVLAHHFPTVPNFGDMTKLPRLVLAGNAEAPDVLVGGTPCQAFSIAGMRDGLNDPRGQLTIKFVELADAIDHVRVARGDDPSVIVWENVPGVLSDKGNAFGCFLGALSGEDCELQPAGGRWSNAGCVFGPVRAVAWRVLDAQYFGVAQRRRRVFVVASARDGFNPAQVLFEFDGVRRDTAPSRDKGASVAALTANGVGTCGADDNQGQAGHLIPQQWPADIACTLNAAFGSKLGLEDQHIRGGAPLFVPSPIAFHPTQAPISSTDGSTHAMGCGSRGGQASVGIAYPLLEVGKRTGASTTDTRAGMGVGSDADPMFTLQAGAQHGVAVAVSLRGREGGATAELGDDVQNCLRASGGGGDKAHVLAPVCFEVAGTMKACANSGGWSNSIEHAAAGYMQVTAEMAVRRLTPAECEKLQGFPAGHTDVPYRGKPAADGPRYKAIGNSMAVPVMAFIGRRIQMIFERSDAA